MASDLGGGKTGGNSWKTPGTGFRDPLSRKGSGISKHGRARFDEFPVLLAHPDSDRPHRANRDVFFTEVAVILARIEEAVALARRPPD